MKEISDNARMLIFVALTVLIFGIFSRFYKPPVQPPQNQQQTSGQTAPGQPNPTAAPTQTAVSSQVSAKAPSAIPAIQASDEKSIVVESPLYRVGTIQSRRGGAKPTAEESILTIGRRHIRSIWWTRAPRSNLVIRSR